MYFTVHCRWNETRNRIAMLQVEDPVAIELVCWLGKTCWLPSLKSLVQRSQAYVFVESHFATFWIDLTRTLDSYHGLRTTLCAQFTSSADANYMSEGTGCKINSTLFRPSLIRRQLIGKSGFKQLQRFR